MAEDDLAHASTTEGLPVAPSMAAALAAARVPARPALVDRRTVQLSGLAILLGVAASVVAQALVALIALVTNLAFYGTLSTVFRAPGGTPLGPLLIAVPVVGGLVVGLLARFGSPAIRGHGIPEAMEQVLVNESRIAPRLTLLKPLSAAIAIGTGGPFGAEGPIIATGGALGSLLGQLLATTASERKILLAAGAAAGMSAIFGSPVSAVLLAVELLLFEFRARSLIPVALASVAAAGMRHAFVGGETMFPMPVVAEPGPGALAVYVAVGAAIGVAAVAVTRLVYAVEDAFERLPFHWMWGPALGGLAVGLVGFVEPATLGVGYDNITRMLGGEIVGTAVLALALLKFVSWAIALGSGTSGGTLAPLFTIGGGLGAAGGAALALLLPQAGVDPRMAALVGMAAMFAGASRALLASVVFAFETTLQVHGLLPLLGGCTAAYLVSCLLMPNTIMTEKIVRRGVRVPADYAADFMERVLVGDAANAPVLSLRAADTVAAVRRWFAERGMRVQHQGFPVVSADDAVVGVVTLRSLLDPAVPGDRRVRDLVTRPLVVVHPDNTLREAADLMIHEGIGRLPVVARDAPFSVIGMLTRSDLLAAQRRRLAEARDTRRVLRFGRRASRPARPSATGS